MGAKKGAAMDLILWRHAHAGDPCLDAQEDLARPLTAKGERQAMRVADWLNRQLPDTTRVLVSPARRTRQTAEALGRAFRTVDALGPDASVEDVLAASRFPNGREAVLIIGHQPTLGAVLSHLLAPDAPVRVWSVRKGAVWWLRQRERHGVVELTVHAVFGPDTL
jgi:phosphohistidine phosphatase